MYKLRELTREDIVIINSWRSSRNLIDNLGTTYRFINLDVENKWYDAYLSNRDKAIRCTILESDVVIGLISLMNIDRINQSAEMHIMVGDQTNRSHGAGTFATNNILSHAFLDMNLNRVFLYVLSTNIKAINFYKKQGFEFEGLLRKSVFKNGKFVDQDLMSILRDDFVRDHSVL